MTKSSELLFKYLGLQISLKNGSVLKMDLWISIFKWDWSQPWELFIFGKIKQKPWCNRLKCFKKIAPWFLPDCSRNLKPQWSGCVSFETWYPKVRFEYWTIFEGYFWAEIFQKQFLTFDQSLIFNVFSYIFKIKDKKQTAYREVWQACLLWGTE